MCKSRITKIANEGCNHMTCPKCKYQWCWLCGATFKEDHFDKWNLFGCRDLQFNHVTKCKTINSILLTMLLIPFILLLRPVVILFKIFNNPLYAPQRWRWCCPFNRMGTRGMQRFLLEEDLANVRNIRNYRPNHPFDRTCTGRF
jgi:hypothetical protein